MAVTEKIEAVKKISKALNDQTPNETNLERMPPDREHFQSLIQTNRDPSTLAQKADPSVEKVSQVSLMDQVKTLNTQVAKISSLTPEDLKNQARDVVAQLDQVKAQLANSQAEINPSYQNLMRHRLSHIDENLKIALSKTGTEYPNIQQINSMNSKNPMEKFLGYLTHSQYQLEHLNKTITDLDISGAEMSPAKMLSLQIKMSQVQQEIELFTALLNKALESTKTVMNVQV